MKKPPSIKLFTIKEIKMFF